MRSNSRLWMMALAIWWGVGFAAHADMQIESRTLPNGLQVVVIPNHKVPAVSQMLWFRVGAIDDPKGKSGLAHYHEHMMFQGTPRVPDDQFNTLIRSLGGEKNAFTSRDFTGYMINIAKEHLPKAMELEADRMMNLNPPQAYFDRERKVILEERKQVIEISPARLLDEQMDAALYRNHPYGIPVIGWHHEMETLSQEDVMQLHHDYYKPKNAVLVLSGDVTMQEVWPLVTRIFGNLPPGKPFARHWTSEPPQNAKRRVELRHPEVRKPLWVRNYAVPSIRTGAPETVYALDLLAQVLGGGSTSRLYRALVMEQKLAVSVSAAYNGYTLGPAEFSIRIVPAADVATQRIEQAVEAEISRLKTHPPTDDELEVAKTLYDASLTYARDGLQGINYTVGSLMMVGQPYDYILTVSDKVRTVTPDAVQNAARLLETQASVTGELLPEAQEPKTREAAP